MEPLLSILGFLLAVGAIISGVKGGTKGFLKFMLVYMCVAMVFIMIYMNPIPSILIIVVILLLFLKFRGFKFNFKSFKSPLDMDLDIVRNAASNASGRNFTRNDVLRVVKTDPAFSSEWKRLRSNEEKTVYLRHNAPAIAEAMIRRL